MISLMHAESEPQADKEKILPSQSPHRTDIGRIMISHHVVEKLAIHAVLEIPETGGGKTPRVSATVDDSSARLSLTMSVLWPASIAHVVDHVRDHIRARIHAQTGLYVNEITVKVSDLITIRTSGRVH